MTQVRKTWIAALLLLVLSVAAAGPGAGVIVNPMCPTDKKPQQQTQHAGF